MIYNKLWLVPFIMLQSAVAGNITAVWANDGGDKVTQDELRATKKVENLTGTVRNRTWDGTKVLLYGAGNEVVSFNLVLEAAWSAATNVSVQFDTLTGPGGQVIRSVPTTKDGVFSWVNRNIELFYTRYFQIKGLSHFGYNPYIELQVPVRFKAATGLWKDRPDHDKFYPDVLIPLEAIPTFSIVSGNNQSIWADIYIPPSAPAGIYTGTVTIKENGTNAISVPVQLQVYGFALPDVPSSKMMSVYSPQDILIHNFNTTYLDPTTPQGKQAKVIRDRYFALAHRHKMALLGDPQTCTVADAVCWEDVGRLTGSTFSTANGYDGPGRDHGQDVYSIGTYGAWNWRYGTKADMWRRTDAWENWFVQNLPNTERFLYLLDEPHQAADLAQVETWAGWMKSNPGPGKALQSFSTLSLTTALTKVPSLSIPCTYAGFSDTAPMTAAAHYYRTTPGKQLWAYNGSRPAIGSFVTEDDGVSMRQLSWGQYKLGIRRWMYWMLNGGAADPLGQALSFGDIAGRDPATGDSSSMYSNGEGVLVYPGTDVKNPHNSYGLSGPMASVRLKQLRRGIQDVDYLAKAAVINPAAVQLLVNQMVPKALWEVGVADPKDPSWVIAGITWPVDPDAWESARAQLAAIILGSAPSTPVPVIPDPPVISNIAVTNVTPTSATVSWSTNNPADGQVDYGTTTAYGFASASANNFQGALNHSVTLSSLTSNTAYHFRVRSKTATSNATVSNDRMFTTTTAATTAGAAVSFIKADTTTRGNWQGVYGGEGSVIVGDRSANPSYVSPTVTGQWTYVWSASTSDPRGLRKANASDRIAATWYNTAPFIIDLPMNDAAQHQVALYCIDWDSVNRRQTVDILDGSGNVLNTQTLSNFNGGVYLVWNVRGHVKIRVNWTAGWNGVVSGLFFGTGVAVAPQSSATFVKADTTTRGTWRGVYGSEGYAVIGDAINDPAYVSPIASGQWTYTWAKSSTDLRALQKGTNGTDRIAGTWYNTTPFTIDLKITDGATHQLALYCVDWDTVNRRQSVEILDAGGNVLDTQTLTNFNGGVYLVWNVSGHVKVRVNWTAGWNGVVSGLFFGRN